MPRTVQHLTIEALLQELTSHEVNTNVFFVNFRDRVLTTTQLHIFLRQYHYFCHRFVKVLEGLLYHTPLEELEMRVELTKTLYSELGSGSTQPCTHSIISSDLPHAAGISRVKI